jgi:small multidrug resistance pump
VSYVYLAIAVVSEVIATSALKASDHFTQPVASLVVVVGYATAFYCLSLTLSTIPLGIAYAIWAGLGTPLIVIAAYVVFQQALDGAAIVGIALILAGVAIVNVFSKTISH